MADVKCDQCKKQVKIDIGTSVRFAKNLKADCGHAFKYLGGQPPEFAPLISVQVDEFGKILGFKQKLAPTSGLKSSPETSKRPSVKERNEKLKLTLETLAKETDPKKKEERVNKTLQELKTVNLQTLSGQQHVEYLVKLGCLDGKSKLSEKQLQAIHKVYGNIGLDKDFCDFDVDLRRKVLDRFVQSQSLAKDRQMWPKLHFEQKVKKLQEIQKTQCMLIGLQGASLVVGDCGSSSGKCNGKLVTMSKDEKRWEDFDELFDTVLHETTHAYQYFLVEELKSGRLKTDDPRYAQAWLFKLNDDVYVEPKENHALYEKQPVEEHAWKSGSEAKRSLNVKAIALEVANIVRVIHQFQPQQAKEAAKLFEEFQSKESVDQCSEILVSIENLAKEVCKPIEEDIDKLYRILKFDFPNFDLGECPESYERIRSIKSSSLKLMKLDAHLTLLRKKLDEAKLPGEEKKKAQDEFLIAKNAVQNAVTKIVLEVNKLQVKSQTFSFVNLNNKVNKLVSHAVNMENLEEVKSRTKAFTTFQTTLEQAWEKYKRERTLEKN